jgi:hypothetical protein
MNAFTITSSKRLSLFEKTINSFVDKCQDLDQIKVILHYDDCSSAEDRQRMSRIMAEKFKGKTILNRYFYPDSFVGAKRHMEIMKLWKMDLENLGITYAFHTEDDFLYIQPFSITEGIELLQKMETVAYVGYSQPIRTLPADFGQTNIIEGNFWKWIYDKNKKHCENLFMDFEAMKIYHDTYGDLSYWCYFINWPYFSFRPGIHEVNKLKTLNTFVDNGGSFEFEFSLRFAEKYCSYCHIRNIAIHIGSGNSSYNLNESLR